jgi:hypothetical protein
MGKWMLRLDLAGQKGPEITLEGILIVVEGLFTADSDRAQWPKHTWLPPSCTYPANCLALYLLSSMAFTATVCQVYVSGSVGTEVVVVVQIPVGHENYYFAIH